MAMLAEILFASRREDWETPQALFNRLDRVLAFAFDACASEANAKVLRHVTPHDDALGQDWARYGRVWLKPARGQARPRCRGARRVG